MAYARIRVDNTDFSIVDYYSSNGGSRCGYCGSSGTNNNYGMWAYELTVQDYQTLVDRGWRRSGQYLYKPILKETCCAMYTIKCGASEIKLSKSQKKILKKMNRFLATGERFRSKSGGSKNSSEESNITRCEPLFEGMVREPQNSNISIHSIMPHNSKSENFVANSAQGDSQITAEVNTPVEPMEQCNVPTKKPKGINKNNFKPGVGADAQRPPCKKAKLLRIEKKRQKLAEQGESSDHIQQQPKQTEKTIEEFLAEPESVLNHLRVELVRSQPKSPAMEQTFKEELKLYQKYQMKIHGDPINKCTEQQFKKFLVNSALQINLVGLTSHEFQSTFEKSSALFAKYEKLIHHKEDSETGPDTFIDFLQSTPLKAWKPKNGSGPPQGYGSFHQQYWIDDKLIAVGVLDILPYCVSSVYFFYDPDYSDFSLGTYGALREIAFVRELHKTAPDLKWYYMGFYIHTCLKMRYKAGFSPSYLLCPEAYSWHPVEKCLPLLDKAPYSRFEPDTNMKDPDGDIVLDRVALLWKGTILPYKYYKTRHSNPSSDLNKKIQEYAALVGRKCAENMLFLIS